VIVSPGRKRHYLLYVQGTQVKWFFHHEIPQIAQHMFKVEGTAFLALLPKPGHICSVSGAT
jgi:hypothetical protein